MVIWRIVLFISMSLFVGSILALGGIISAKPLDDLSYKGWTGYQNHVSSPYASSVYLGWAMASIIALIVTGVLPIVSWFSTYRFSLSSACCIGLFADKASFGASVGYFSFLFLLAGRALTVLLSPPVVVYSPTVLPVYVYDAYADCGKNVRATSISINHNDDSEKIMAMQQMIDEQKQTIGEQQQTIGEQQQRFDILLQQLQQVILGLSFQPPLTGSST